MTADQPHGPAENTDRELYREDTGEPAGSYYENSVHVTRAGTIGMNVGGRVVTLPIVKWHALAWPREPGSVTADLPPDTAARLSAALQRSDFAVLYPGSDRIAAALLSTVAQLVAERTEALELSLASDRRHILDELHMLGVLQDEQAKLADARAEAAAEALELAAASWTPHWRPARTVQELLRDRAAAIRKGRKA